MSKLRTYSLLVVDPSDVFRRSLRGLICLEAPRWRLVGEADDEEQALEAVRRHRPDVVLLERTLPGRSGLDALPEIRSACPSTRVLMTSVDWDRSAIGAAMERGAAGVLPKEEAASRLLEALRRVADGDSYTPPELGGPGPDSP